MGAWAVDLFKDRQRADFLICSSHSNPMFSVPSYRSWGRDSLPMSMAATGCGGAGTGLRVKWLRFLSGSATNSQWPWASLLLRNSGPQSVLCWPMNACLETEMLPFPVDLEAPFPCPQTQKQVVESSFSPSAHLSPELSLALRPERKSYQGSEAYVAFCTKWNSLQPEIRREPHQPSTGGHESSQASGWNC